MGFSAGMRGREPRLSLHGRDACVARVGPRGTTPGQKQAVPATWIHGVPRENLFLIGAALTYGGVHA
jgi:hypothetical protein